MKTITNCSLLLVLFFGINLLGQEERPDVTPMPIGGMKIALRTLASHPDGKSIFNRNKKIYDKTPVRYGNTA